jgi:hypothetical protein
MLKPKEGRFLLPKSDRALNAETLQPYPRSKTIEHSSRTVSSYITITCKAFPPKETPTWLSSHRFVLVYAYLIFVIVDFFLGIMYLATQVNYWKNQRYQGQD